jgi:hypothetical protein
MRPWTRRCPFRGRRSGLHALAEAKVMVDAGDPRRSRERADLVARFGARLSIAPDPATAFLEAVAEGPLDDGEYAAMAIRLAFSLDLDEAVAIANTLAILINPPEPDWTGDEDA